MSKLALTRPRQRMAHTLHSEFDEKSLGLIGTDDNAALPCLLYRRKRLPTTKIEISGHTGSPLPTHLTRPFRIMWTASIPGNVRQAVENDWYSLASYRSCPLIRM
jgi:hypothetical protein